MRRKILITAQAMVLATHLGTPLGAAEPTTDQLNTIAAYLEANDVQALRAYLDANPELAEGGTPLAALLRRFLVESMAGNSYFRFRPDLSDAVRDSQTQPSGGGFQAGPPGPGEPAY